MGVKRWPKQQKPNSEASRKKFLESLGKSTRSTTQNLANTE